MNPKPERSTRRFAAEVDAQRSSLSPGMYVGAVHPGPTLVAEPETFELWVSVGVGVSVGVSVGVGVGVMVGVSTGPGAGVSVEVGVAVSVGVGVAVSVGVGVAVSVGVGVGVGVAGMKNTVKRTASRYLVPVPVPEPILTPKAAEFTSSGVQVAPQRSPLPPTVA